MADALDKARYFILGCENLTIAVDHKQLLRILGDRSLEDIPNSRLRNLKEKTLRYRFSVIHIPGVKHCATDCISRHPTNQQELLHLQDDVAYVQQVQAPTELLDQIRLTEDPYDLEESLVAATTSSLDFLAVKSVTWDRVRLATASDESMNNLLQLIETGLPELRHTYPPSLRDYHQFHENLHTMDGVILYKDRVPGSYTTLSSTTNSFKTLHSAHQGVTTMISRAEASVFWRCITPAITATRTHCLHCNRNTPSNPGAPPTPLISPEYPFQCICADFFHHRDHNYLVIVDRYSNWPRQFLEVWGVHH